MPNFSIDGKAECECSKCFGLEKRLSRKAIYNHRMKDEERRAEALAAHRIKMAQEEAEYEALYAKLTSGTAPLQFPETAISLKRKQADMERQDNTIDPGGSGSSTTKKAHTSDVCGLRKWSIWRR